MARKRKSTKRIRQRVITPNARSYHTHADLLADRELDFKVEYLRIMESYHNTLKDLQQRDLQRAALRDNSRQDGRRYHPARRMSYPKNVNGDDARITVGNPYSPMALHFSPSRDVLVCARRKVRREVIHALKLNKKGAGTRKKPRRTPNSEILC